jgi:capsular exopolysaccharide synthesis family protein
MGINEKEFHQRTLLDKILDYKKSVIAIIVLVMTATVLYLITAPKVYTTDAIVEVSPKMSQLGTAVKLQSGENVFFRHLQTQIDFLQSRSLIERVVTMLNDNIHYFEKNGFKFNRIESSPYRIKHIEIKDPSFYEQLFLIKAVDDRQFSLRIVTRDGLFGYKESNEIIYPFGKPLKTKYFDIEVEADPSHDVKNAQAVYFKIYELRRYVEHVLRNLSVLQNNEKSSMIKIQYADTNAYSAKQFVNTLVDTYLNINTNNEISEAKDLLKVINAKLIEEKAKLDEAADLLKNYIGRNKVAGLDEQTSKIIQTIYSYELKLEELKIKLHKIEMIQKIYRKNHNYKEIASLVSELNNIELDRYIQSIAALEKEYLKLRMQYTEKHPDIQKLKKAMAGKLSALTQNLRQLQHNTKVQIKTVKNYLQKYKADLSSVPQKEFGYTQLRRQYDLLEKHYLFLLEKKTQMIISDRVQGAYDYRVIDYAYEPPFPSKPKAKILFILGLIVGTMLAITYALLRDYFSRYVKTPSEVEELTDLPYLGTIPYIKDKKLYNDLFVLKAPHHLASEMMWSLRASAEDFVRKGSRESGMVIAVTSIIKGEGKTTIAANLALCLGMGDKRTVVVSMDARLPELHLKFRIPNDAGITSVICGSKTLKEVTFKAEDYPNFAIIPAGDDCPNPLEMINSNKIDFIISYLRQHYDYIVLDLPPIGVAAESIFLMRKADLVLSVLKAHYSEKSFVTYMDNIVTKHHLKSVGFVLNGVDKKYIKILMRKENKKYIKSHNAMVERTKKDRRFRWFNFLK